MLRSGEISISELAEAHLRQIQRLNPQLNAFADFECSALNLTNMDIEFAKSFCCIHDCKHTTIVGECTGIANLTA